MDYILPKHESEVQQILQKTSSCSYLDPSNGGTVTFFDQRIEELENLRYILYESEQNFFAQMNCTGNSSRDCLLEIQERIHQIENANQNLSINSIINECLNDTQLQQTINTQTIAGIQNAFQNTTWVFDNIVNNGDSNSYYASVINEFCNILNSGLSPNVSMKVINRRNEKFKWEFHRILDIKYSIAPNGKIVFNISVIKGDLSDRTKADLITILEKTNKIDTQAEFKKNVINVVLKMTANNSSLISHCLRQELLFRTEQYDLNRSVQSLTGFLEEVWTNALFSTLVNQPGSTVPTGNLRNILYRNTEIPVDMVFRAFNFQIKHWTLTKQGTYTISGVNKGIATLINRAEISISDILIQFFASYQFNQPFTKKVTSSVEEYTKNTYSQFPEILTHLKMQELFQAYIDKIMRIDNVFQTNETMFGNYGLYYNTFFIINDKIVPASSMVQAIIDVLRNKQQQKLIEFNFTKLPQPDPSGTTLEKNTRISSAKAISVADLIRVSYTIKIRVQDILDQAYYHII